jgi:hypothetical protein
MINLPEIKLTIPELVIIATLKPCERRLKAYARRWQIETLFAAFKGRGFNLEDICITNRLRCSHGHCFCWAHRTGEWQHENVKPIKIKNTNSFQKVFLNRD